MERWGDPATRSNYDILRGALTSFPLDSTRHAYLMSNLDRLYEAYLRAWETIRTAGPVEDSFGLVRKRAAASTVSSKSQSPDWVAPSGSDSSETLDDSGNPHEDTKANR
jgi:hypothetical protein